ncbi:hypothetical protein [Niabella drilacis]|uniref:hypothetical protein n=1 Tax=Niabella drilacis (strain DSM 25811 / CCM 8410 / CCUG 62505 / LMG 26954 / E90) TaxID=1285928 RepID=UPI00115F853A|nr:hypothetical protein [Niabella drilacis]
MNTDRDLQARTPRQTEKKLQGSWVVYKVGTREAAEDRLKPLQDTLSRLRNRFELTALTIGPRLFITEDSTGKQQQRTWQLLPPDMIETKGGAELFEIVSLSDSILTLSLRIDNKRTHADALLACYRVDPERYEGKDLAHASLNQWRQHPQQPETPVQIASRLTSLLRYDALYLEVLNNSNSDYFNTRRFHLPFSYYNGGMGLKDFDPASQFAALFYDGRDAEKAYGLLKEYFNTRPYPRIENYMQAYAGFMKNLAEVIELNVHE